MITLQTDQMDEIRCENQNVLILKIHTSKVSSSEEEEEEEQWGQLVS